MIKISAYLKFYPTEERTKLNRVLQNLMNIPEESILEEDKQEYKILRASIEGLQGLKNLYDGFRNQRTVQTARKILMDHINGTVVSFMLHKQALYVKRFHFAHSEDESPMGPVWVIIESDQLERLINYLVPQTEKGHVLEVDYIPE
jgi:predicted RNA binding protein with dsRBD fold (UPF0201 family)